jgi:hypothetical protein
MNANLALSFSSAGRHFLHAGNRSEISCAVFHDSARERARAIRNATAPTFWFVRRGADIGAHVWQSSTRPSPANGRVVAAGFVPGVAIGSGLVTPRACAQVVLAGVGRHLFH